MIALGVLAGYRGGEGDKLIDGSALNPPVQFGTPAFLSALGASGVRRKEKNAVAGIVLADGKGITIPRFLRIRTWGTSRLPPGFAMSSISD